MLLIRRCVLLIMAVLMATVLAFGPSFIPTSSALPLSDSTVSKRPPSHRATRPARHRERRAAPRKLSAATTVLAYPAPPVQARAAVLVDLTSGATLYAKNADARLPMASTTKITTAAVALAHARLSDLVSVSKNAATVGESTMSLVQGERLTVRQLLYGMLLNSGNDAAVALAEHVGGTQKKFVGMMNSLASSLGMRNTRYATPHGLDAAHHFSSARDLATIAEYALRDATFRKIVSTENFHIRATKHNKEHWLGNINHVMYWYPGVDGVKPGDTDAAGLCQVVSDWRDGHHLLAVLLNTPTLWIDIRNLLNYGARDFRWVQAPIWSDGPASSLNGGSWTYYFGAGHYIRDAFLHYFRTHGGLATLGYPRTDEVQDGTQAVQYFQGGALVADPRHGSVYPLDLGRRLAEQLAPRAIRSTRKAGVASELAGLYRKLGGAPVLGGPVTNLISVSGHRVQFFEYGELAVLKGAAALVPVGDEAMRVRGWLPAPGAADAYPPGMMPAVEAGIR